jgi:O-antigen ligase
VSLPAILTGLTLLTIVALAGLFYRRPAWGLGLFIFSLPFERIGSYPLNPATGYPLLHAAQVIGAGLIGGWLLGLVLKRRRPSFPKSFWFLLAFLASAVISALLVNVEQVWQILVWLIFIVTLFLAVADTTAAVPVKTIRKSLVITALLVGVFGLYQLVGDLAGLSTAATGLRDRYTKEALGFTRIQSTALEPLYYANYLFLPLLVLLALGVETGLAGPLEITTFVVVFLNFVLTLSRGGYVSGGAGLLLLIILSRHRFGHWLKHNSKAAVVILLSSALLVMATVTISVKIAKPGQFSATTALRNFLGAHAFETGSFTERVRDQRLAITIFKSHPVFGVGIGGFGSAYYDCKIGKCVYRPNNQALEVLAEGGIIGFTAFHLFLLAVLYYGWRALSWAKSEQRALIIGLMAAIVAMVAQSQTFSGFLCCLTHTWATLGILAGLSLTPIGKIRGGSSKAATLN